VFLHATYCKARVNRRVVSQVVVIATGVTADGRREVLGFDVGNSEDGAFWTAFLCSLKAAIGSVFLGAAWQRRRFHFMRNVLAVVPKGNQEMVAAAIRTIFAQPDAKHVGEQSRSSPPSSANSSPRSRRCFATPKTTCNAAQESQRRTDVVRVFPNPAALLRLAGAVLVEAHDEWQVSAERRYLSEHSMAPVAKKNVHEVAKPELMTA
jgi:putative transposase